MRTFIIAFCVTYNTLRKAANFSRRRAFTFAFAIARRGKVLPMPVFP